ncbi:MAG TPA: DUF6263 family protein, partial [Bacteroidales bacterium]|nr:DUF6263 family protein [Bacteroidales bacterium]
SNFKNQFGDQTIKEMMDSMFSIYPDQPVGIGDSWTRKSIISHGYPMIIDNTWTLKDRQGGRAVIEMNSLIKPNPGAAPMEIGPMKLRQEFTGGSKGTLELDEATGWVKSAKMDQQLSGELTVEGSPQSPEGMTIPMTLKTAITVESF